MWRRGGSETQGVEWLSIGASGWSGGDAEVRGLEARWIRVAVGRSQGGNAEAQLVRNDDDLEVRSVWMPAGQ
jgi:hypothetical protein